MMHRLKKFTSGPSNGDHSPAPKNCMRLTFPQCWGCVDNNNPSRKNTSLFPFGSVHGCLQRGLDCLVVLETELGLLGWAAERGRSRNWRGEKVKYLPASSLDFWEVVVTHLNWRLDQPGFSRVVNPRVWFAMINQSSRLTSPLPSNSRSRYVCPRLALPECWSDPFGFAAMLLWLAEQKLNLVFWQRLAKVYSLGRHEQRTEKFLTF